METKQEPYEMCTKKAEFGREWLSFSIDFYSLLPPNRSHHFPVSEATSPPNLGLYFRNSNRVTP